MRNHSLRHGGETQQATPGDSAGSLVTITAARARSGRRARWSSRDNTAERTGLDVNSPVALEPSLQQFHIL